MTDGRRVSVLLVGHGSARHPQASRPVRELAETLHATGRWHQVTAAFMKQDPPLDGALERLDAPAITVVVPVFAGKGYYTDTLIPRALGLADTLADVRMTPPVGTHPAIPQLLADRAATTARSQGWPPGECGLLIIAHGSARPGGSGETPRAIADAIAGAGTFAETALAFLEQEPFATAWRDMVTAKRIVALPLLVAQGMHASQDIPPLFGLAPGGTGPTTIDDRQVVLATGLGAEPALADIVADMVAVAVSEHGPARG